MPGRLRREESMVEEKPAAYLDAAGRKALLGIARRALEGYVREGNVPREAPVGKLAAPGAAFVTLTKRGRLRGCIGYTEPVAPLCRVVQECAVAAATEDPRFPPVSPEELAELHVEISVLTPLFPIRPEEVEVGRHGLLVSQGRMRGLLLPQVPVEQGWDRETFLDQTCGKAGLPPSAWRHGATLQGFTAEVFGEE
ncbi:MAG TPA: AmmeMemoRadiSam system protein A [Candidatus Deferrimicrobiaceae bacterium]